MRNFNNSHKLLTGILALVLVAGMTTPAFAGGEKLFEEACPDDCEVLALIILFEDSPDCEGDFDSFCEKDLEFLLNQCIKQSSESSCPVGGEVGSMSTTSLLVAGAQANMGLWSLALVGIVGAAAAVTYKLKSNKTDE